MRAAGRGGGTSLPGKVLTRLEPHAIGLLAAPARARQRGDQRHQRQDDDGGDDGRDPRADAARRSSTTARARTWPAAWRPRSRPPRGAAGASSTATSGCSRSTSSGSAPVVEELAPRALLLGNLFRDQLDRYGELEIIADRWAEVVAAHAGRDRARAQRRRPARRRPRPRPRAALLRRRRRLARVRRAAARRRLQALPPLRASVRLRGDLPRPPRPLRLPELRRAPARAGGRGARGRAARHPLRGVHARTRPAAARGSSCRCPGLYNVYNALGAAALCLRARRAARRGRRRAGGGRARVRARRDASTSAGARPRSCWSRTRRAPTRCCARWRWRASSSTCSACSTTTPPTGATSPGSGTPTGSCSRRRCGA